MSSFVYFDVFPLMSNIGLKQNQLNFDILRLTSTIFEH